MKKSAYKYFSDPCVTWSLPVTKKQLYLSGEIQQSPISKLGREFRQSQIPAIIQNVPVSPSWEFD